MLQEDKCWNAGQWFSDYSACHLEGLLQHTLLGSIPRVSGSMGLKWDRIICISDKLPGDADTPGQRPYFENH